MQSNKTVELANEQISFLKKQAFTDTNGEWIKLNEDSCIELSLYLFEEKLKSCPNYIGQLDDDNFEYIQTEECINYLKSLI